MLKVCVRNQNILFMAERNGRDVNIVLCEQRLNMVNSMLASIDNEFRSIYDATMWQTTDHLSPQRLLRHM